LESITLIINKLLKHPTFKNAYFSVIDAVFLPFVMLLATPLFLKQLGTEQYGMWMLINSIIASMAILNIGGVEVVTKYVSASRKDEDTQNIKKVFSTLFILQILLGAIISILIIWLAPILVTSEIFKVELKYQPLFAQCLIFGGFVFVIKMIEQVMIGFLRGQERYDLSSIMSIFSKSMLIVTQIVVVINGGNLSDLFLYSFLVLSLILGIEIIGLKLLYLEAQFLTRFSINTLTELLNFSGWAWLLSLASLFALQIDRWLIGALVGMEVLAYYAIALLVFNQIHAIIASSLSWIFPKVSKMGVNKETTPLLYYAQSYAVILSSLVSLFLVYFNEIFLWWLGEENYQLIANYLKYFLVLQPIYALSIVPYYFINGLGLIKYNFFNAVMNGLLKLFFMFLLFKSLGMLGIMIGIGISLIISSGYALWIAKSKMGIIELPIFKLMLPVILYAIIGFYRISDELNGIIFSVVIVLLFIIYYKNYLDGYKSFFGQWLKAKLK
jgi:O-antigen/teichoic acid export membrane protein